MPLPRGYTPPRDDDDDENPLTAAARELERRMAGEDTTPRPPFDEPAPIIRRSRLKRSSLRHRTTFHGDERPAEPGGLLQFVYAALALLILIGIGYGLSALGAFTMRPIVTEDARHATQTTIARTPTTTGSGVQARLTGSSTITAATTPTPLAEGWTMLPGAIPDASREEFNGQLFMLTAQPYQFLSIWGGDGGALCRIQLATEQVWVPCWRLGLPNATPLPTPPPPPPPPTWTPIPQPPCYQIEGIKGTWDVCTWDNPADVQAKGREMVGDPLTGPPPTVCVASTDGTVTICGIGGEVTMKGYADLTAEAQRPPTVTPTTPTPVPVNQIR